MCHSCLPCFFILSRIIEYRVVSRGMMQLPLASWIMYCNSPVVPRQRVALGKAIYSTSRARARGWGAFVLWRGSLSASWRKSQCSWDFGSHRIPGPTETQISARAGALRSLHRPKAYDKLHRFAEPQAGAKNGGPLEVCINRAARNSKNVTTATVWLRPGMGGAASLHGLQRWHRSFGGQDLVAGAGESGSPIRDPRPPAEPGWRLLLINMGFAKYTWFGI